MRKVSGRRRKGNHKTHFVFNNFFGGKYFVIYEVMWKNIVELGRLQTTIWWMCTARWIHTVTEYVIMIFFSMATMVARTNLNIMLYTWSRPCFRYNPSRAKATSLLMFLDQTHLDKHTYTRARAR